MKAFPLLCYLMSLKPQCLSVQCVDSVVSELGTLGCRKGR